MIDTHMKTITSGHHRRLALLEFLSLDIACLFQHLERAGYEDTDPLWKKTLELVNLFNEEIETRKMVDFQPANLNKHADKPGGISDREWAAQDAGKRELSHDQTGWQPQ